MRINNISNNYNKQNFNGFIRIYNSSKPLTEPINSCNIYGVSKDKNNKNYYLNFLNEQGEKTKLPIANTSKAACDIIRLINKAGQKSDTSGNIVKVNIEANN